MKKRNRVFIGILLLIFLLLFGLSAYKVWQTFSQYKTAKDSFSALYGYTKQSYCEAHPTVEWETEKGIQIYTVYIVATVDDADAWYDFVDAADEADFLRRLDALKSSASYCTEAVPKYGDRLLTLSTCYGLTGDDRLIVVAVQTD